MERIIIIGSGGAGKSTLARQLHSLTGLPLYHLDKLYWKKNWTLSKSDEQLSILTSILNQSKWIIDGNYGSSLDLRLQYADTIIFLDYPTYLSTYRVLKRIVKNYKQVRPDMGGGNAERFDWPFLRWVVNFNQKQRPLLIEKLNHITDEQSLYVFKQPTELSKFIKRLKHRNL